MTEIVYIYALLCPFSKDIKYIGKTVSPKNRIATHMYQSKKGRKGYVYNWIRSLTNKNQVPIMNILTVCDKNNWEECEKKFIKQYKNLGCKLTNILEGGNDGPKPGFKIPSLWKEVYMLQKNTNIMLKEFPSVIEASTYLNKNEHVIAACCRGKRPTAYGFSWTYKNN